MDMGKRIEELRKAQNMTLEELGDKVGVGKSTVRKWENGMIANMRRDKIAKIANALGVSPANLMGWNEPEPEKQPSFTEDEIRHIKKYRSLDSNGRKVVEYILDEEFFRCRMYDEAVTFYTTRMKLPDYGYIAAAGRWIYDSDLPKEYIYVKPMEGADFIVGVSGDSMQPTYEDGQKVYVRRTTDLEFGDIGIFQVGNEYYIKELGPDGLHSHNPKWPVIPKSDDIVVIGKVLGIVEEKQGGEQNA